MLTEIKCKLPETRVIKRKVWNFAKADWPLLKDSLEEFNWEFLRSDHPDDGAINLTNTILELAEIAIGRTTITECKSTHPWLTDEIIESQRWKKHFEGTEREVQATLDHSELIRTTREEYIKRTRHELRNMKKASKQWWKTSGNLLGDDGKACAIPAMKNEKGEWCELPKENQNYWRKHFLISSLSAKAARTSTQAFANATFCRNSTSQLNV